MCEIDGIRRPTINAEKKRALHEYNPWIPFHLKLAKRKAISKESKTYNSLQKHLTSGSRKPWIRAKK
jgi:hypothetical protein